MTSKPITFFAVISLALASLTAFADSDKHCPGGHMMMSMEMMDLDKNGEISADEMKQFHASHFKDADANQDGAIDLSEFQNMREKEMRQHAEAHFKAMDTNG